MATAIGQNTQSLLPQGGATERFRVFFLPLELERFDIQAKTVG